MEPLVEVNLSEENGILDGVVEKRRAVEDDDDVMLEGSPPKRIKEDRGDIVVAVGDVKKVAEIVLMLSAMGKMRGGKEPSEPEKELMTEARKIMVKICQGFAPKDVSPWDAFGGVIEDLGLNKLKDQRLGFRHPKISIAEKLIIFKRKMEKAEDFSLPTVPHSSQYLQGNSAPSAQNHFSLYPGRTSQLVKAVHMPISPLNVQSTLPLVHGSTTITPSPYQLPTSEIRPASSTSLTSSHLGLAALPKDRTHLRSDGIVNGSSDTLVAQANTSANTTMRTPTRSVQYQPVSAAKNGDNKVAVNAPLKVAGEIDTKSGVVSHGRSMAVNAQSTAGLPSQSTTYSQGPLVLNSHAKICKLVLKLLHPRGFERPAWNSPSRDYMNKALTCQMCMSIITEIDNVLICDGCEKGYHLKCLQTINQKGVPRGEWHCRKCLSLSNGKSLPPKYGRVMRNATTNKVSVSSTAVPSSLNKNDGGSGSKTEHLNAVSNGNDMQKASAEVEVDSHDHHIVGPNGDVIRSKEDDVNSGSVRTSNTLLSGDNLKHLTTVPNSNSDFTNSLTENNGDEEVVQRILNPTAEFEIVSNSPDNIRALATAHDGGLNLPSLVANQNSMKNHTMSADSNQLEKQEVANTNPVEISCNAEVLDEDSSHLHTVSWVGDSMQTLDDKTYYSSCCVNGHTYITMDHILIRSNGEKLIPSRLQAMWEDNNTRSKWITVNRCYFPSDSPEGVGRPYSLESNEVYESSCGTSLMAGLIENPCLVLPPRRFEEESERRIASGRQLQMPPLYLCKWIYDEAKGLFRDVSY